MVNNFYPFPTPDGQTFSLIALNIRSDRNNSFIQLYPKELDLGLNQLFVEAVLSQHNAVAVPDPEAPSFAREIRVQGDYIVGALVILCVGGYIDEEICNSVEERLKASPLPEQEEPPAPGPAPAPAPLPPLAEKLEAFVLETQNQLPQEYVKNLLPLLLEYTPSIPLKEIIEMAKGYFPAAWVKTAIAEQLPEKVKNPEILEKLCPQSLQDYPELATQQNSLVSARAVVQLEQLAAKKHAEHQEVLDDLTQVAILLNSHEGALPPEQQSRVEAAVDKISKIIPTFDVREPEHIAIQEDIKHIWNELLMPKLGLNIPCEFEMETDFDHETALLLGMLEEVD